MFPYDGALAAAVRNPPNTVDDVIGILQTIAATCVDGDGLKWFNWLYLEVTQAVKERVNGGGLDRVTARALGDSAWIAQLDLEFARLYFGAVESALSIPAAGAGAPGGGAPGCWEDLFTRRNQTALGRIQFALAGINAHINHDLPLAIVAACRAKGTAPRHGSVNYNDYTSLNGALDNLIETAKTVLHVRLLGGALPPVSHLEDMLAAWSVSAAREAAWNNAELLWRLSAEPQLSTALPNLSAALMNTLDGLTGLAGKAILSPVP